MKSEFLSHIKETMRSRRYAKRTIESYLYWIKAYIIFIGKIHPKDYTFGVRFVEISAMFKVVISYQISNVYFDLFTACQFHLSPDI